ncbi:MAG: hypothetical protein AAFV62_00325 [Pseudomonadota bacterium]
MISSTVQALGASGSAGITLEQSGDDVVLRYGDGGQSITLLGIARQVASLDDLTWVEIA